MPYVTQTRSNPLGLFWEDTDHPGLLNATNLGILAPLQVTTSFRRGRLVADPALSRQADEVLYQTYGENFRKMKLELQNRLGSIESNRKDNGHTFSTEKQSVTFSHPAAVIRGNPSLWYDADFVYKGPLAINHSGSVASGGGGYPPYMSPYTSGNVDGTKAISNTIPTASVAGLNTGIAEIVREGLPRIIGAATLQARAGLAKAAGREYLNVEFGWKPLVRDIRQACQAVVNANSVIRQFQRDSGKIVRRRYTFAPEIVTVEKALQSKNAYGYAAQGFSPSFGRAFSVAYGPMSDITTTTRTKWFSGAYTYYVQSGDSLSDRLIRTEQLANHLLGTRLSPDVLWELAPWSWLFDWVLNIGDVLHNAEALTSDSLVIRYGYLMCTSESVRTRTLSGLATHADGPVGALITTSRSTRKQRFRSSPYGFGATEGSFSPRQWAILAAIGLTRSPNKLDLDSE